MMFNDRESAADLLADRLIHLIDTHPVIAAIPRGAVPMGRIIADRLEAELTAVLVHKIASPYNEELAIGCIGVSGRYQLLPWTDGENLSQSYIDQRATSELRILHQRKEMYSIPESHYSGRTVVVVDDGIATGATTICAIQEVKLWRPGKIILATPVSSREAFQEISPLVDEMVVLEKPMIMFSISQFYRHFPQVSDEDVIKSLQGSSSSHSNLQL